MVVDGFSLIRAIIEANRLERAAADNRQRVPEPMVMEGQLTVDTYASSSEDVAALQTVYEVSARALDRLVPVGGVVVDLGCGPGAFLRYFATQRPDTRSVGLDLSAEMLEVACRRFQEAGIDWRVTAEFADATAVRDDVLPDRVDAIASLNLLHQFPDVEVLDACLAEIARLREAHGCAVWLLDLARLRSPETMGHILDAFEPNMPPEARRQTLESEAAAFSVAEMEDRLRAAGLGDLRHAGHRPPPMWQAWWAPARDGGQIGPTPRLPTRLPAQVRIQARLFTSLPRGVRPWTSDVS